jgi:hypothetical protein
MKWFVLDDTHIQSIFQPISLPILPPLFSPLFLESGP